MLLVQIEAVLNSRPLMPMSTDPSDLSPLTPAYFLIERSLTSIPENNYETIPNGRLSRIQLLAKLNQNF